MFLFKMSFHYNCYVNVIAVQVSSKMLGGMRFTDSSSIQYVQRWRIPLVIIYATWWRQGVLNDINESALAPRCPERWCPATLFDEWCTFCVLTLLATRSCSDWSAASHYNWNFQTVPGGRRSVIDAVGMAAMDAECLSLLFLFIFSVGMDCCIGMRIRKQLDLRLFTLKSADLRLPMIEDSLGTASRASDDVTWRRWQQWAPAWQPRWHNPSCEMVSHVVRFKMHKDEYQQVSVTSREVFRHRRVVNIVQVIQIAQQSTPKCRTARENGSYIRQDDIMSFQKVYKT